MNKEKINNVLKIVASLIIISTLFVMVKQTINNTQEITQITRSAGIFGPIVLIALIMLGILFSPIPSIVIIIAAGYMYGPIHGAIYSYIGHVLGANGVYFAVKKFKILHKIEKSEKSEKYKKFVEKNKNALYLSYAIPIIPVTITSIIAATAEIKFKKFIEVTLISFLPAIIVFSFLGGKISNENMVVLAIIAIIIIAGTLLIIKRYKKRLMK